LKNIKFILFSIILLISVLLTACSEENLYEVIKSESKVTELEDQIRLEFDYEIVNNTDEEYYFTLVFPSYIQEALVSKGVGLVKLSPNGNTSGVIMVAARKDGAEMSEETIEALKNNGIPFVERILIGKTVSVN
jgi:hypothetical protein